MIVTALEPTTAIPNHVTHRNISSRPQNIMENSRIVFLDYLRVIACLMVIIVHCVEPFYLGGEGTLIQNWNDGFWCTVIDSALRAAVPLFVMASSYLQFPVKYDTLTFFKKRLVRVGVPFVIFSLLYTLIPLYGTDGFQPTLNVQRVLLNFVGSAGHLWFIYMLLGLYLLMPMLSPWIDKISKKEEQIFLILWGFTTTIPFFRLLAQSLFGLPEVWGEASWNEFGTFYYVSGFVGYMVLGHYFRKHVGTLSWKKTLTWAVTLWIAGYAIAAGGFWQAMPKTFPVSDKIDLAVRMETTWGFCSTGVMLTTVAYFLVIRKITATGWFYRRFILPISKLSYGMYLMHIFILVPTFAWVTSWGIGTPATIFVSALLTFLFCAGIARLISLLPKNKYLIG